MCWYRLAETQEIIPTFEPRQESIIGYPWSTKAVFWDPSSSHHGKKRASDPPACEGDYEVDHESVEAGGSQDGSSDPDDPDPDVDPKSDAEDADGGVMEPVEEDRLHLPPKR